MNPAILFLALSTKMYNVFRSINELEDLYVQRMVGSATTKPPPSWSKSPRGLF